MAACLLAPFGLALGAAALHRYPYGMEARLMQFAAPSICLLGGQGFASILERVRIPRIRRRFWQVAIGGLVACGVAPQVVSFLHPYRMLYDHQAREFARGFWASQARDADVVCYELDFAEDRAAPGTAARPGIFVTR